MSKEKCFNCIYFHKENYVCRRFPPNYEKGLLYVREDDFCGEFVENKETKKGIKNKKAKENKKNLKSTKV